jgi:hypothetical protein
VKILSKSAASITVQVSRSNLEALLAKLNGHPPDSACTLLRYDKSAECYLRIQAVEDDAHYASRDRGIMHSDTEAAMYNGAHCTIKPYDDNGHGEYPMEHDE